MGGDVQIGPPHVNPIVWMFAFLGLVAGPLTGGTGELFAQGSMSASDTAGVELAVSASLRESKPSRQITFQDFVGPFVTVSEPSHRPPQRVSDILAALGGRAEPHPVERICAPPIGQECQELVVRIDRPVFLGDSATVMLRILVPTKIPHNWSAQLLVRRQGAGWVFGRVIFIDVA